MAKKRTPKVKYVSMKTGFKSGVEDWHLTVDQTYTGKQKLMLPELGLEMTPEQSLEYARCKLDCVYFIKNYYKIISIDDGLIVMDPFDYQTDLLGKFEKNRFNIVCQCRQSGKTTIVGAFILWYALFHESKEIAILANKEAQSKEILERIKRALLEIPYFLQSGIVTFAKTEVEFENGCKIFAYATSSDSIRGRSPALLYWDEAAFVDGDEEFWESTYPALAQSKSESRCIITSTPRGKRGVFYKIWQGADPNAERRNEFERSLVRWDSVPIYRDTPNWEENKRNALTNDAKFEQEFNCEFMGSSGALINTKYILAMIAATPLADSDEYTKVFRPYDPTHSYMACADVGGGEGGDHDYSVLTMLDVTEYPFRIAAKYRNNEIDPLLFPYTIENICNKYGRCPVVVESNNYMGGQATYILEHEIRYERMIKTSTSKNAGQQIQAFGPKCKAGVNMTASVRSIGVHTFKSLVENGKLVIDDLDTIDEVGTFVLKRDKYQADNGCHDDCIMPLVMFSWLTTQEWFKEHYNMDIRHALATDLDPTKFDAMMPMGGLLKPTNRNKVVTVNRATRMGYLRKHDPLRQGSYDLGTAGSMKEFRDWMKN